MLETLSDDWLPERRSSNCALLWTKPQLHFNSHCRPDRSADAWRTQAFGSRSVEHNSVGRRRCAFDLVSKGAMMSGLFKIEESGAVLLFVRQFYGRLSTCSGMKTAKYEIVQREGGPFDACALEHTRGCGCSRHFASNGNLVSGRHSNKVKTDKVEVHATRTVRCGLMHAFTSINGIRSSGTKRESNDPRLPKPSTPRLSCGGT